ncbi:MAG: hypothetical protein WA609_04800 [Terriglobales bacterium]
MKQTCRNFSSNWRDERLASQVLLHARIVTDPKKLAQLRAEAGRRKRRAEAVSGVKIQESSIRGDFWII